MDIRGEVRRFIIENFLFGEGGDALADEQSFLESGILDSTGVLELVEFVEGQFSIRVEDDELVPENLDSIERLTRFVELKMAKAA
jgi:acyl carrier protein